MISGISVGVRDVRVRPMRNDGPSSPRVFPLRPYCVLRLGKYHHRTGVFPAGSSADVPSRCITSNDQGAAGHPARDGGHELWEIPVKLLSVPGAGRGSSPDFRVLFQNNDDESSAHVAVPSACSAGTEEGKEEEPELCLPGRGVCVCDDSPLPPPPPLVVEVFEDCDPCDNTEEGEEPLESFNPRLLGRFEVSLREVIETTLRLRLGLGGPACAGGGRGGSLVPDAGAHQVVGREEIPEIAPNLLPRALTPSRVQCARGGGQEPPLPERADGTVAVCSTGLGEGGGDTAGGGDAQVPLGAAHGGAPRGDAPPSVCMSGASFQSVQDMFSGEAWVGGVMTEPSGGDGGGGGALGKDGWSTDLGFGHGALSAEVRMVVVCDHPVDGDRSDTGVQPACMDPTRAADTQPLHDRFGHLVSPRNARKCSSADDLWRLHEPLRRQRWQSPAGQNAWQAVLSGGALPRDATTSRGARRRTRPGGHETSTQDLPMPSSGCQGPEQAAGCGAGAGMLNSSEYCGLDQALVRGMVWGGVPAMMREDVYMLVSGAVSKRDKSPHQYASLVKECHRHQQANNGHTTATAATPPTIPPLMCECGSSGAGVKHGALGGTAAPHPPGAAGEACCSHVGMDGAAPHGSGHRRTPEPLVNGSHHRSRGSGGKLSPACDDDDGGGKGASDVRDGDLGCGVCTKAVGGGGEGGSVEGTGKDDGLDAWVDVPYPRRDAEPRELPEPATVAFSATPSAGDAPQGNGPSGERREQVWREIEVDLERVFNKGRARVNTAEGVASMRRVLRAYSLMNQDIGYCQGMNFLVGALLEVVSEEATFWLLAVVCEDLNPGYYTGDMLNARSDIAALKEVIMHELPALYKHAEDLCLPLELLITQWLVVVFVNCFPPCTALRVLEVVFVEGSDACLATAIAFLRLHEQCFLETQDMQELVDVVGLAEKGMYDADLLLDQLARELPGVRGRVRAARAWHLRRILLEHEREKKVDIGRLTGSLTVLFVMPRVLSAQAAEAVAALNKRAFMTTHRLLGDGTVRGTLPPVVIHALQWCMGWKPLSPSP